MRTASPSVRATGDAVTVPVRSRGEGGAQYLIIIFKISSNFVITAHTEGIRVRAGYATPRECGRAKRRKRLF